MANKYYGIRDNWTDDDLSNVVDITSEDGVITEVNVPFQRYLNFPKVYLANILC